MRKAINIGLLGCGVVGSGVLRLLAENAETIQARLGGPLNVKRVVARDKKKSRSEILSSAELSFDPQDILNDPGVDIVVEVMGGVKPAENLVRQALEAGKSVVTANKALIAEKGHELVDLAEKKGGDLYFEAAVGGGVPMIRALREALASDRVLALRGIVNGTTNYMLTHMHSERMDFDEALRQAQAAGYAEADPSLDINGGDAAHKLTILATLAFGAKVQAKDVATEGIQLIRAVDMEAAERFGYVIKHLAIARVVEQKKLDLRVHPALVPKNNVLASISGALNALYIRSHSLGPCLLSGYGAGALPTAVSVMSDVIDLARNLHFGVHGRVPPRGFSSGALKQAEVRSVGENEGRHYLRFTVVDKPGVLSSITGLLGEFHVSIEQIVQQGRAESTGEPVSVVIVTHHAVEKNVDEALVKINALDEVVEKSLRLRIIGD